MKIIKIYYYIMIFFIQFNFNCSGCIVYQWNVITRKIINKLDCSKLIPCSESLKSISIEERLSPGKCQVLCINVLISMKTHHNSYNLNISDN